MWTCRSETSPPRSGTPVGRTVWRTERRNPISSSLEETCPPWGRALLPSSLFSSSFLLVIPLKSLCLMHPGPASQSWILLLSRPDKEIQSLHPLGPRPDMAQGWLSGGGGGVCSSPIDLTIFGATSTPSHLQWTRIRAFVMQMSLQCGSQNPSFQ